ncbi:MAG: hypothetical protein Q8T11_16845 [Elusimicrobiota bacterium]|nr:hypothetical protein [Elusimicrobiota bacterium]
MTAGLLLTEVRDRALARPWLLAPPLLGMLGQNVLSLLSPGAPGAMAIKSLLAVALTVAVTALFAELWLGDGRSVDPKRLVATGALYAIPYPLLLVFGVLTTPVAYWLLRADVPQSASMGGLYLMLAAGKLAAFALGAVSSIAAARRSESAGALGALLLGARVLGANALFFFLALAGFWAFQEMCVILTRALAPGMLSGFFTTIVPLLGCVAFPIEAWRSGRLKQP